MVGRDISITWVKGHAGQSQNEICDYLARTKLEELKAS